MVGFAAALVASLACVVYGVFLFAGNESCYRLLCGGDSFLALDPSDAELRESAHRSAVAVWLVVAALWSMLARSYVFAGEAFADACLAASVLAGVAVVVIVVLQVAQCAELLRRSRG